MQSDFSQFQLLLVGARVCQLKPFLEARGLRVNAASSGTMGRRWLSSSPPDLVILELNLDDIAPAEFVALVKEVVPHAGFLLVEDRDKAGQIARALEFGIDAYISTPPDEERLFLSIDRQLLAVAARTGSTPEKAQLLSNLDELQQAKAQLQMQLENLRKSSRDVDDGLAESQTMALNALLSQEGSFEDALQVVQARFEVPQVDPVDSEALETARLEHSSMREELAALVEQVSVQEVAASELTDELEQQTSAHEDATNLQNETAELAKKEEAKLLARIEAMTQELKQKESIQLEATQKLVAMEQTLQQTMQQMQERTAQLQKEKTQAVKAALESLKGEKKALEQAFVRADELKEQVENRLLTMDVEIEEFQDDIQALNNALTEKDVELRQERMLRVEERESMLQEIRDAKARAS